MKDGEKSLSEQRKKERALRERAKAPASRTDLSPQSPWSRVDVRADLRQEVLERYREGDREATWFNARTTEALPSDPETEAA